jgi:iron(III) transport system permease protein
MIQYPAIIFQKIRREKVMYSFFLLSLAVLALFLLYPLSILFYKSFLSPKTGNFSFYNYIQLFVDEEILQCFLNTLKLGFWCVLITTAIAVPMAFGVSRTNMPFRSTVRTLSVLTFASPSFIGAIAWIILMGPRAGRINEFLKDIFGFNHALFDIFTFSGVIFVSALFMYPFVFLSMTSALDNMDSSFEDAATILGASRIRTLISITIPMIIPSIISGMILVFLECFVLFGVPAFLGMPAGVFVMSTKIYHLFLASPPRYEMAAALATPILIITAFILYLEWHYLKRRRYVTVGGKVTRPEIVDLRGWKYVLGGFSIFVIFLAVILPSLTLLESSFLRFWGRGISWSNISLFQYKELLLGFAQRDLLIALKNSFILGLGAAFLCIIFSFIMAWIVERTTIPGRNSLSFFNMSAMSFPAVALALGLVICYSNPPLALYGTLWILLVGYMIKGFPISFLFIRNSIKQISPELEEASRILGGSWFKSVKDVTFPLIKTGLFSTFLIIFILKFRDLPTSILLYTGGNEVIGVMIYQYVDEAYYGIVAALSSLVLIFNLGIVYVSRKMAGKGAMQL